MRATVDADRERDARGLVARPQQTAEQVDRQVVDRLEADVLERPERRRSACARHAGDQDDARHGGSDDLLGGKRQPDLGAGRGLARIEPQMAQRGAQERVGRRLGQPGRRRRRDRARPPGPSGLTGQYGSRRMPRPRTSSSPASARGRPAEQTGLARPRPRADRRRPAGRRRRSAAGRGPTCRRPKRPAAPRRRRRAGRRSRAARRARAPALPAAGQPRPACWPALAPHAAWHSGFWVSMR